VLARANDLDRGSPTLELPTFEAAALCDKQRLVVDPSGIYAATLGGQGNHLVRCRNVDGQPVSRAGKAINDRDGFAIMGAL
jgi:hypothetical protein